jgi:UPF0271 protein
MTSTRINLNADLGESFGAWRMGDDDALLPLLDSANIACGFHAGDPLVMRKTIRLAAHHGVSIGAHPSFPDLQGFGRRRMSIAADELQAMILYQIGALAGIAQAEGSRVTHVKPHGALSNMACEDAKLAASVVAAVRDFDPGLILLAPALSPLAEAGHHAGLTVVEEIFADRAYLDDGQLMPRGRDGAVIHDPDQCCRHVAAMLAAGGLVSHSGTILPTRIGSICVHGDGAGAIETARRLRQMLLQSHGLASLPDLAAQ